MSWRRLGVLIAHLPAQSHTKTAVREALTPEQRAQAPVGEGHGPWSHTDLLLAAIADGVHVLAWQQTQIHGGKKTTPPEPIRRPGVEPTSNRPSQAGITYLNDLRERRRNARGDSGR